MKNFFVSIEAPNPFVSARFLATLARFSGEDRKWFEKYDVVPTRPLPAWLTLMGSRGRSILDSRNASCQEDHFKVSSRSIRQVGLFFFTVTDRADGMFLSTHKENALAPKLINHYSHGAGHIDWELLKCEKAVVFGATSIMVEGLSHDVIVTRSRQESLVAWHTSVGLWRSLEQRCSRRLKTLVFRVQQLRRR